MMAMKSQILRSRITDGPSGNKGLNIAANLILRGIEGYIMDVYGPFEKETLIVHYLDREAYEKKLIEYYGSLNHITSCFYPVRLARGFADRKTKEVFIKGYLMGVGNRDDKLLWHELGHIAGYSHTWDPTDIMFPYFFRGGRHIEDIRDAIYKKYDLEFRLD